MKKILSLLVLIPMVILGQTQTENYIKNTTYKQAITTSIATPTAAQASQSITYFDGLGRPIQQIAHQQSGTGKDIVTPLEYDAFGRQDKEYLPYVPSSSASLAYKTTALTDVGTFYNIAAYDNTSNPYSQKLFEASPLNRVLKQAAPGTDWAMNSGHEIKLEYQTNTASEVKLFIASTTWNAASGLYDIALLQNGNYDANQLYKTITYDENTPSGGVGAGTEEFKNKEGQIVLKRTYDAGEAHDTYYVYDDYANLTYVIPPLVTNALDSTQKEELCYQYKYDYRNRLVEKKLPGKQWEFIVYDKLDRVVATSPAFSPFSDLTTVGWLITKYDAFSRVVYTGWENSTPTASSRTTKQNEQNGLTTSLNEAKSAPGAIDGIATFYTNSVAPTTFKLLTVNYYDDYNFNNAPTFPAYSYDGLLSYYNNTTMKPKGMPTGSWVRVLTLSNSLAAETSYIIYNNKARPVTNYTTNYLGGYTKTELKYDFIGNTTINYTTHKRSSTDVQIWVNEGFTYTPQSRLLNHTHQINTKPVQLLASNTYDELGKLISKNVGNTTSQPLQKVDYSYNIRGWMTGINNDPTNNLVLNTGEKDLFSFKINYNTIAGSVAGVQALYNGNISETYWRTGSDNALRKYGYEYDNLNRLRNATYQKPENVNPVTNMYNENLTYDKNGNILSLFRNGNSDAISGTIGIDNLTYNYAATSNKLLSVLDNTNNTSGFKDGNTSGDDYEYDLNGNLTTDKNKGITAITYNHLNLPTKITLSMNNVYYLYDALGRKVRKTVSTMNNSSSQTFAVTDYFGGFQYTTVRTTTRRGSTVDPTKSSQFFPTAEGYYDFLKNSYVFNYTDHLGNVRLSYQDTDNNGTISSNEILEESNYYPFGLKHSGYNSNNAQAGYKYKYNGKEFQDELGLNMYDYGWRNYMPDIGRWSQIDPLFNDLKFANDNSQVDEDDQQEVYMAIINDLELGGAIYNTDNLNPYGYGYNNPVSFDDPDGRCPACWGALIGAGVDIALQMATNAATGKDVTDIKWGQVAVSAGAGALSGGISSLSKIKSLGALAKVGVEIATDTGISVGSQAINDGKVSLTKTAIDVGAGQLVGRGVGKVVEKRVVNSAKGKHLQANINREKNVARGKSNTIPKNKADVNTAKKKLDTYVNNRSSASSTTASGAASTTVEKIDEKRKNK